ncbi:MAG TPA: J domain-containing protein [Dehalococcoidia bacterium]|nr:J domain-containing protein [Dehalococcoidia bacterium]
MDQKQWLILWEDYYEILQVHRNATLPVIEAAYRRLSQEYHPDKVNGDNSVMKSLNRAHDVLSDEVERRAYDCDWDIRDNLDRSSGTYSRQESSSHSASNREDDGNQELYLMEAEAMFGTSMSDKGDLVFTDRRLLYVPRLYTSDITVVSIPYHEIATARQENSYVVIPTLVICMRDGGQWKFVIQKGVIPSVLSFLQMLLDPATYHAYVAQFGQAMPIDLEERVFGNGKSAGAVREGECAAVVTGKFAVTLITNSQKRTGLIIIYSTGFAFYQNPVTPGQSPTASNAWRDVERIDSRGGTGLFRKHLLIHLHNGISFQFEVSRWDRSDISNALAKAIELYSPTP